MQMKFRNILATAGLAAVLAGCGPSQTLQSTKPSKSANIQFVTKPTHSAVLTGNYATPSNIKGTTLGTVNSKDMKSNLELSVIDGHIVEVRTNTVPATNELNFVLSYALKGSLSINTANKTQELRPETYLVPTLWSYGSTDVVRQITIDPSHLKANIADLAKVVKAGGGNGTLNVSGLADFGLRSRNILTNKVLFFNNGTNGLKDYVLTFTDGIGFNIDLQKGTITTRNNQGFYTLKEYGAKNFESRVTPSVSTSTNVTTAAPVIKTYGP